MDEFGYINPADPNAIADIIAGRTPSSKAQATADGLRAMGPPKKRLGQVISTSLTPNVAAQEPGGPQSSSDWYQRGLNELEKPVDYASAIASQKEGRSAAERALLLALASGVAGPEYKGMEKYALNKAASHGPMKLQGAVVDEYGNVVEDPNFNRERRGDIYMKRGDVASRGEQAAADRKSREEQRAEDRALRRAIEANKPSNEPMVQVQQEDGSIVYMPRSQAAGQKAPPRGGAPKLPANLEQAWVNNNASTMKLDDAFKAVEDYPDAFGPSNYMGNTVKQYTDPKGVPARAKVSDIGSLKIHDRSGAAVTIAESPRLMPFIPQASDPPGVVKDKLKSLRQMIEIEQQAISGFANTRGANLSPNAAGQQPGRVVDFNALPK